MVFMTDGKICKKCNTKKLLSDFHKCSRNKSGVQSKCKNCASKLAKERYIENTEKVLLINARWRNKHRDRHRKAQKQWEQKNPSSKYFYTAVRRARKKNATPAWADMDRIKYTYAHCHWLNKTFGHNMHVDHIVPLNGKNVCGLHVHTNLQIIPAEENMKKSNRVLEDL
jgi:hypothetical protein